MAITVADNFSYQGGKPLDARMKYDSVANMVAVPAANLYDGCFAYVTTEQKYYSYDSANNTDPTLGKWREYSGGGSGSGGHTIEGDGTAVTDRDTLNFKDMSVSDDSTNEKTDVKPHRLTQSELADIISPLPFFDFSNPGAEAFIFSTNERVIGQWIDGKPLYQKVITVTLPLTGTTYDTATPRSDYSIGATTDLILEPEVIAVKTNAGTYIYPSSHVSNEEFIKVWTRNNSHSSNPNTIAVAIGTQPGYLGGTAYIRVRYTKTTDQPVATGEKIVGQWIDGKPIYQKTFTGTCTIPKSNGTSSYLLDLTSLNIENDISIDGYFKEGDNKIPINGISVWDSATFAIDTHYSYTQKKLVVHNVWDSITNSSYTITLRYTKT